MSKIKSFLFLILLVSCCCTITSQSWISVKSLPEHTSGLIRNPKPVEGMVFELPSISWNSLRSGQRSAKVITLPIPNGNLVTFSLQDEQVMEDELQRKYSDIRAYKGYDITNNYVVKLSISKFGLNAVINGSEGLSFVTPAFENNTEFYDVYSYSNASHLDENLICGTKAEPQEYRINSQQIASLRSATYQMQEYRLALTCTGEWGAARGSIEKVLADWVTSVNILNTIFEVDLGARMKLVGRADSLVHLDGATDPFAVSNVGGQMLPQGTGVFNSKIGVNSYDIGHIYSNGCTDVGGVAYIRAICAGNKGGGVSCVGSNLARNTVQIVAHEIGHQLGANHTFHSCGDNREDGNDFEPGGGSTIMSYSNLCGSNSFVPGADPYYHFASLREIYRNIRTQGAVAFTCAAKITTANLPPTIIEMPANNTFMPANTPFMLLGRATDPNNDALTYTWEQKDSSFNGTPLGTPSGNAPLFRSYPPRASNARFLPREPILLGNNKENTEVLPTYTRKMSFALAVRDNNKEASAVVWDQVNISVINTGEQFQVTSFNKIDTAEVGQKVRLTWNVAMTDLPPINTKRVDLYLSKDGDLDIRSANVVILALGTPNDGSEDVVIPNFVANSGRFIVKASNGLYFDINDQFMTIKPATKPRSYFQFAQVNSTFCLPNSSTVNLKSEALSGYRGKIRYDVLNLPQGATASFSKNNFDIGEATDLKIDFTNQVASGSYPITIRSIGENADTMTRTILYEVTSTNFEGLSLISPASGLKNATVLPEFQWRQSRNTDNYEIQLSEDPNFPADKIFFTATTPDLMTKPNKTLDLGKVYFWRVRSSNSCKSGDWTPLAAYGTEVLDCRTYESKDVPANISASGRPTIEAKVNIDADIRISDINIKLLDLDHDNLRDITATIISPKGTPIILFESQCPRKFALKASFDDEAPNFFNCQNAVQFKALDTLAKFKSEPTQGQWTLKLEDKVAGNGGRLNSFNLEVCGNIPVENPLVDRLNTLQAAFKANTLVSNNNLQFKASTSTAGQLVYTVIALPKLGNVLLSNVPIKIGDKFTQLDIDQQKINYQNTAPATLVANQTVADSFAFIVTKSNGFGWEGIRNLRINISTMPTSVNENDLNNALKLHPNPTHGLITLELPSSFESNATLKFYSQTGILVKQIQYTDQTPIDISDLANGQYIIQAVHQSQVRTIKVSLIK